MEKQQSGSVPGNFSLNDTIGDALLNRVEEYSSAAFCGNLLENLVSWGAKDIFAVLSCIFYLFIFLSIVHLQCYVSF